MKLTKTERWILSNQYRILEKLCPDEADEFAEAREVVECGYEQDYGGISQHIDKVPMSVEDCKEVVDILSMFSEMKYAFDTLDDKSGIEAYHVEFPGFSGNTEFRQLGYARHLCKDKNKFPRVVRKDNLDSHAPLMPLYQSMLEVWKKMPNKDKLTREDVIHLNGVKE